MEKPDSSIFSQNTVGDSGFENVYIYGKLNYDFGSEDIVLNSLNVTGISSFTGNVKFTGDIDLDEITCRNANVTGIATVGSALYINGKLHDVNGETGSAGMLLSSTGNSVDWIAANTTSVLNAINVGVNEDASNVDQFVTFVELSSGNHPNRVDAGLKYNPSTNTLTVGNIVGDISGTTGGFVEGMIMMWAGSVATIPTGWQLCNGSGTTTNGTSIPDLRNRFVLGAYSDGASVAYPNVPPNQTGGDSSITLSEGQMPQHFHHVVNSSVGGTETRSSSNVNANNYIRKGGGNSNLYEGYNLIHTNTEANQGKSDRRGSGSSIDIINPYYSLAYIIKT